MQELIQKIFAKRKFEPDILIQQGRWVHNLSVRHHSVEGKSGVSFVVLCLRFERHKYSQESLLPFANFRG